MKHYVQCPDCKSVKLIDVQDPLFCDHCKKWFSGDEYVILSALSVRQPWSFLICAGFKDIENRTWKLPEKMKGKRVLIHASAKPDYDIINTDNNQIYEVLEKKELLFVDDIDAYCAVGAIIGSVEIVDCVINHLSIWAEKSEGVLVGNKFFYKEGQKPIYNWVLKNPVLFEEPILNVKGRLGFFKPKID